MNRKKGVIAILVVLAAFATFVVWHENGQKYLEEIFKDNELVEGKYWNSKGEPVDSAEEAIK